MRIHSSDIENMPILITVEQLRKQKWNSKKKFLLISARLVWKLSYERKLKLLVQTQLLTTMRTNFSRKTINTYIYLKFYL